MPPGVAADLAQRTFTVPVRGRSRCPASDAVTIEPRRGSRLRLTVRRDALAAQPRGWLTTWTEQAESQGCIAPGQGAGLATRIVEAMALPSGADLRLLRVDGIPNYVEIGAGNRLQVISPILREGANPDAPLFDAGKTSAQGGDLTVELKSSADLIGFETAWYDLRPKPGERGFTIMPASAETSIKGKVERQPAPARNYFQSLAEMGFYRLFYKADQSEVLAAAGARAALPADPETCNRPGGPVCLAIPRGVGVNPYLMVRVNGTPVAVGIGSNLRSLMRAMRQSEDKIPANLAITRLWAGKPVALEFDHSQPDILGLVLTGNEQIRW